MWPLVCQSPYHSLFLTHLCYILGPYKNLYWIKFQLFSSKLNFCLQHVSSLQPGQFPNPSLYSPSATLPMWSFCLYASDASFLNCCALPPSVSGEVWLFLEFHFRCALSSERPFMISPVFGNRSSVLPTWLCFITDWTAGRCMWRGYYLMYWN